MKESEIPNPQGIQDHIQKGVRCQESVSESGSKSRCIKSDDFHMREFNTILFKARASKTDQEKSAFHQLGLKKD